MHKKNVTNMLEENDSPILKNSVPVKMLVACFVSCIVGIILMAVLSHYLLMGILAGILLCLFITTPLVAAEKISVNTACMVPMLLICFVYTPASWFTFDGLLGCTPYLSILYITTITLTYYNRTQVVLLCLYSALMVGLIVHWLLTWPGPKDTEQIVNILVAYAVTAVLNYSLIESVKRKNSALNQRATQQSLQDELTGLLNRRAIEAVLNRMESRFRQTGAEYALVMLDIDKFKAVNDRYGHNTGDTILKHVATSIACSIRSEDYAFRFGGDEFLLVLPHVTKDTAKQIYGRIGADMKGIPGQALPINISYGCALRSEGASPTEVLALADKRMYEHKQGLCRVPDAFAGPNG